MAKARGSNVAVKKGANVKAAVFNMVSPSARVQVGEATVKPEDGKPIKWGDKDDLPHEYLRLISESGTASSCMRRKQQFVFADGFVNKDTSSFEVNETQTADALLQDMSGDAAVLSGVALRVRYVDGKVYAENLPFECVRKLDNGFLVFNPTMGQKEYKKDQNEILSAYSTRDNLIAEAAENADLMAEKGQIYYYYEKVKGAYDYPVPVYASKGALADIENDTEIAIYDLDEVKSGFRLNAIMTAIGDFREELDENGIAVPNPDLEDLKEQLRGFTERKSRDEARKKILLLTAETQEMIPKLEPFNNAKALELLDPVTERIANKVCRDCNVPPVLIGIAKPGQLGQTQEISNMIQLFNMDIVGMQNMIQRIFSELWPEVQDWTISTLNPINYIPSEVVAKMTEDEIRAIGGLAPLEKALPTETEKTLTALQALSPLVANKVLESMTTDEIRALIALPPKVEPDAANN